MCLLNSKAARAKANREENKDFSGVLGHADQNSLLLLDAKFLKVKKTQNHITRVHAEQCLI